MPLPKREKWKTDFKHNPLEQFSLNRIDGDIRVYETPEGNKYPSVTSILSCNEEKKKILQAWRDRIGEEAADKESLRASTRGTAVHLMCEHYLNNLPIDGIGTPTQEFLFKKLLTFLNKIDKIHAQEIQLYSDALQAAGTCDCIGKYDGVLSIIDFKTSSKEKLREWITDYFLQCTMYSIMVEEMYGIRITNLVVIIAVEQGFSQVFTADRKEYLQPLKERLIEWRKQYNGTPNSL